MTKVRLTRRMLNAIVDMAGYAEADGVDNLQGHTARTERERAFIACLSAGKWAAYELKRRQADLKRRNARKKARAKAMTNNPEGWQSIE